MHVDMSTLNPAQAYATMTQTVVPRPVAWILTENDGADYNLAPFSYFNALSSDPPMVVVSVGLKPDGGIKDTRHNLEKRRDCVIHIAHREMAAAMTASSATLPHSEVTELGLETKMIKSQWIAFLELTDLYLAESVVGEDKKGRLKVLADKVDPIGRLGGGEYVMSGEIVNIDRPA